MSEYAQMAKASTMRPWEHFGGVIVPHVGMASGREYVAQVPHDDATENILLITALVNAGDDIAALYEAVRNLFAFGYPEWHPKGRVDFDAAPDMAAAYANLHAAHEKLAHLFGDEDAS